MLFYSSFTWSICKFLCTLYICVDAQIQLQKKQMPIYAITSWQKHHRTGIIDF